MMDRARSRPRRRTVWRSPCEPGCRSSRRGTCSTPLACRVGRRTGRRWSRPLNAARFRRRSGGRWRTSAATATERAPARAWSRPSTPLELIGEVLATANTSPITCDSPLEAYQAALDGHGDGLRPGGDVQLLEDDSRVELHRALGNVQALGDLLVAEALHHELQHLHLPVGEGIGSIVAAQELAHATEQLGRDGGLEQRPALVDDTARAEQL